MIFKFAHTQNFLSENRYIYLFNIGFTNLPKTHFIMANKLQDIWGN